MSLLTGLAILSVGIVVGVAISKWVVFQQGRASELAHQLDEVHAEYASYQEKVDQHFRKTADLLNQLSSNYGAMHQHLALGVQTLSQRNLPHVAEPAPESTEAGHALDYPKKIDDSSTHASATINQPKDYAPKAEGDPGLLSQPSTGSNHNA